MKFGYVGNGWGPVLGTAGAVTDIASGFYTSPCDLEEMLDQLSDAGYDGVEIFDGDLLAFEDDPERLTEMLSSRGMELTGVYTGGHFIYRDAHEDEYQRFCRSIDLAKQLGAKYYVIGGGAVRPSGRRDEDYVAMAELLDRVAERASEAGLVSTYHPHLGSLAETPEQVDKLFAVSTIDMCADTAHLAAGGADVPELLKKYSDRLPYVHLKNWAPDRGFLPLSEGEIDMTAVIDVLRSMDYSGWVTVELDGYDGDAGEAAKDNREYLRNSALDA